jgi:PhoPQ-activated pathogenicity-related protein
MHTLRVTLCAFALCLLAGCSHAAPIALRTGTASAQANVRAGSIAASAIARYVLEPDPQASWTAVGTTAYPGGTEYELSVTSQVWHGVTWTHRILLAVPAKTSAPGMVLLSLRGGDGARHGVAAPERLATATGIATAFVYGIPNEPLFHGLSEDLLLGYTLRRELATGDETWPLFLPMTKAVVRCLDALQAFGTSRQMSFDRFIVEGHSKRGGTAWFAGAVDRRIVGIIPGGFDVLNVPAQLAHLEAEPYLSSPRAFFIAMGLWRERNTTRGNALMTLVDPYSYRDDLTLPKLVVVGTNDAYYDSGAAARYWSGLPGPKWLYCLPNGQHKDEEWSPGTDLAMAAFVKAVAAGKTLPSATASIVPMEGGIRVSVTTSAPAVGAELWSAPSATGDFHQSAWGSGPLAADPQPGEGFSGSVPDPPIGCLGAFAAVTFDDGSGRFELMTPMTVVDRSGRMR